MFTTTYHVAIALPSMYHSSCVLTLVTIIIIEDDLCREALSAASAMFAPFVNQPQYRGFAFPDCDNPASIINFLNLSADCCSNGGVTIPSNVTVASTTFTTNTAYITISSSLSQTQMPTTSDNIDVVATSVGSTVAVLIVLALWLFHFCTYEKGR